jgi:NAD(P)-dependent dehydrogenase (short-subunit alcohol dehydrogenase family)
MLLHVSPRRILGRFFPEPLPSAGLFDGQTVLVTGGTTGLGLAAAIHFASLGAEVIITCRNASRGEVARQKIEYTAHITGKGKVTVMGLDMSRYATCVAFVDELKNSRAGQGRLDVAVLNAGSINPQFEESPEGWEETLQVNTLSTTLLGLLLLAWMKEERTHRKAPAHIVFVTSRDHLYPDITHWAEWAGQEGILRHFSSKENWPTGLWATTQPNYANSKLLVMYAIDKISKQALGPNGEPQVVVNSVCPGLVHTDIGRAIANQSRLMKIVVPVYLSILGKSPDYGARFYVTAALRSKEEHGKFLMAWLIDEQYRKKAIPNMTSDAAKKVKELAWKEIIRELTAKVPALQN